MKCRWPDCDKEVPTTRWLCKEHFYLLPYRTRMKIHSVIKKCKANHDPAEVEQEIIDFAKAYELLK